MIDISKADFFSTRTDFLESALNHVSRKKVLDVGNLGDGKILVEVKNIVEKNGGEHWGLDCNKNLAEKLGYKNQYVGDLHDLHGVIEDETFDYIYAGEIIEHTWNPGKMIMECYRMLKPGGKLLLDTPNAFCLHSVLRFFLKRKDTVGLDDSVLVYNEAKDNFKQYREVKKEVLSQPQHKIFYSPAMMRQLLNMHGFEVDNFIFITKGRNIILRLLLKLFPQGGPKMAVIATKSDLDAIFNNKK